MESGLYVEEARECVSSLGLSPALQSVKPVIMDAEGSVIGDRMTTGLQ